MIRRRVLPSLLLLCVAGSGPLRAELTEAQKKELIRKQHAGSPSRSSAKKKSSSGKSGSGKGRKSGSSKSPGSSNAKKSSSASTGTGHSGSTRKKNQGSSSSGQHGAAAGPSHHATPANSSTDSPKASHPVTPSPEPQAASAGVPAPILPAPMPGSPPLPLPHGSEPSAPITIEKSGLEAEQGLEPAPVPSHEGFWGRLFGSHKAYSYLTPSLRRSIDRAPVKRGRWKYIVVHNSGTREGNARVFDVYHRRVRHMQNGLAYHFVIGDGHGSGDGQIEVGDRWKRQINGGHVASDYLNDIALGICLVGDFNRDQPTKAQVGALEELVSYLRERVGKSQGRRAIVHAHKEINPRPTDCPGDRFPYGWLHAKFGNGR